MGAMHNLLPEPPATLLPANDAAATALAGVETGGDLAATAARFPAYSEVWAELAMRALRDGDAVTAYAYARTGYHRGLDQLRRNGWKGFGPVPYSHEPNRGFLRCVAVLARASQAIGENDEHARCLDLLEDCDPRAAEALGVE